MSHSSHGYPVADGPGSVYQAPNLPPGFTGTFTSRYVDAGDVRLHAVIGGEGPALLLVHGWPQNWYSWRKVMPALAERFEVIAVDQRGVGLSERPLGGYDTATLAGDLAALMDSLGHDRFAVAGQDTGAAISYALAADHLDRVSYLALIESPGPPGTIAPLAVLDATPFDNTLWHVASGREHSVESHLLEGKEDILLRSAFDAAGSPLESDAIDQYLAPLEDPDALRASFGWYRALNETVAQDQRRRSAPLLMPVLALGGSLSFSEQVAEAVAKVAEHVEGSVIAEAGHFIAEEAPEELLAALTEFFTPHLEATSAPHAPSTVMSQA